MSNQPIVKGVGLDAHTRCAHWHSDFDVVAIKFPCCDEFYACADCHEELAGHAATLWPADKFATQAILCGACGELLTVEAYLALEPYACPSCDHPFNPGCKTHIHLYFETEL